MKTKFRPGKPAEHALEKTDESLIDRAVLLFAEMAKHPERWPNAA